MSSTLKMLYSSVVPICGPVRNYIYVIFLLFPIVFRCFIYANVLCPASFGVCVMLMSLLISIVYRFFYVCTLGREYLCSR